MGWDQVTRLVFSDDPHVVVNVCRSSRLVFWDDPHVVVNVCRSSRLVFSDDPHVVVNVCRSSRLVFSDDPHVVVNVCRSSRLVFSDDPHVVVNVCRSSRLMFWDDPHVVVNVCRSSRLMSWDDPHMVVNVYRSSRLMFWDDLYVVVYVCRSSRWTTTTLSTSPITAPSRYCVGPRTCQSTSSQTSSVSDSCQSAAQFMHGLWWYLIKSIEHLRAQSSPHGSSRLTDDDYCSCLCKLMGIQSQSFKVCTSCARKVVSLCTN